MAFQVSLGCIGPVAFLALESFCFGVEALSVLFLFARLVVILRLELPLDTLRMGGHAVHLLLLKKVGNVGVESHGVAHRTIVNRSAVGRPPVVDEVVHRRSEGSGKGHLAEEGQRRGRVTQQIRREASRVGNEVLQNFCNKGEILIMKNRLTKITSSMEN